jgi:hypothetical protein
LIDDTPQDFLPIEQALKRLPYHAPSPDFSDRVMARVTRFQHLQLVPSALPSVQRPRFPELASLPTEIVHYARRPLPVRMAAMALMASAAVTMAVVLLFAVFQLDLFVVIARVFGEGAVGFLTALASTTATNVLGESTVAYLSAAGPGAVVATIGMFALGAAGAAAGLRAAASATRKAA